MQSSRHINRIKVEISVTLNTVLETIDATIADLTEFGAQVRGASLPEGSRFSIEYLGETVFAQCRWSEIDRMGVKFLFPLSGGPLYERLQLADGYPHGDESDGEGLHPAMAPIHQGQTTLGARTFGRATVGGQFGRRP